jgi:hypothetical protein
VSKAGFVSGHRFSDADSPRVLGRARLHSLRKNSDFDLVLKGRGFSRAVSAAKSIAALAAAG